MRYSVQVVMSESVYYSVVVDADDEQYAREVAIDTAIGEYPTLPAAVISVEQSDTVYDTDVIDIEAVTP